MLSWLGGKVWGVPHSIISSSTPTHPPTHDVASDPDALTCFAKHSMSRRLHNSSLPCHMQRKRILKTSVHEYTDAASVKCPRRRLNPHQGQQLRRRAPLVQRGSQVPDSPPEPHNPKTYPLPFARQLNSVATSAALPPSPHLLPNETSHSSRIFNRGSSGSPMMLGDRGRDLPGREEAFSPLLPSPLGYFSRINGEMTKSMAGRGRHREQQASPVHSFVDSGPLHGFHPPSPRGQRPPAASNYRHFSCFEDDLGSPVGSSSDLRLLGGDDDDGRWYDDPDDAASITARCPRSPPRPQQQPRGALTLDEHQVDPVHHQGTDNSIDITAIGHSSAPFRESSSRIRSSDWDSLLPTITSSRVPTATSPGHHRLSSRDPMMQLRSDVLMHEGPISRTSSRHDPGVPGGPLSLPTGHPLLLIPPRRRPAPFKTAAGRSLDLDCIRLGTEEDDYGLP